jgi:hypothetical protein
MRERLRSNFRVEWRSVPLLTAAALSCAHMVILNMTTAADGLSAEEQAALHRFLQSGGSGLLSAFSNWSSNGRFHDDVVGPLGVVVISDT